MDDLLKDAIADAKAVRETALANAKIALEEAFTPRIQSMLSNKIQSEMEGEDEAPADEQDEEPVAEEGEEEAPEIAVEPEEGEDFLCLFLFPGTQLFFVAAAIATRGETFLEVVVVDDDALLAVVMKVSGFSC